MLQYLIKWKGYPHSDNTWEPASQVHAPELTEAYHRKHPSSVDKNPRGKRAEIIRHLPLLYTGSPDRKEDSLSILQERRYPLPRPSSPCRSILLVAPFSKESVDIHSRPRSSHLRPRRRHPSPFIPHSIPRFRTQTRKNTTSKKTTIQSITEAPARLAMAPNPMSSPST